MFPLSLYLFHQSCSSELPPALPLQQPLFILLFHRWTCSGLWSPIFCSHWEESLFSPFSMVFFLLKTDGIFSYFQSLLPHAAQVLLIFLTHVSPHCSHSSLPHHCFHASPLSVCWSGLLSLADNCLGSGQALGYVTFSCSLQFWTQRTDSLVLWDIESGIRLECSSSRAMLCFLALSRFMGAPQDLPSAITSKSRTKFKRSGANLLIYSTF